MRLPTTCIIVVSSCLCFALSVHIPQQNIASGVVQTTKPPKGNTTGEYEPPELEGTTTAKPKQATTQSAVPVHHPKVAETTLSPTPVVSSTFKTYFVQTKTRLNPDMVMQNHNNIELSNPTHLIDGGVSSQNFLLQTQTPPPPFVGNIFNKHNEHTPFYDAHASPRYDVHPTGPTIPPSLRTSDVIQGELMNSNNVQVSLVAPASKTQDKFVDTSGGIPIVKEIFWPQAMKTQSGDSATNDTVFGSLSFGENRLLSALSNPKSLLSQQMADKTKPFDPGFGGFVLESNHEMNRPGMKKKKPQSGNGWISIDSSDLGGIQSASSDKGLSQPKFSENSVKPLASGTGGWVEMNLEPKNNSQPANSSTNKSDVSLIKKTIEVKINPTSVQPSGNPGIVQGVSKIEVTKTTGGLSFDSSKPSATVSGLNDFGAVPVKESLGDPISEANNQQADSLVVVGSSMSSNGVQSMSSHGSVHNSLQGPLNINQITSKKGNVLSLQEANSQGNELQSNVVKLQSQAKKDLFFKGVDRINGALLEKSNIASSISNIPSSSSKKSSSLIIDHKPVENSINLVEAVTTPAAKSVVILNPKVKAMSAVNKGVMENVFSFKSKSGSMASATSSGLDISLIQELGTQTPPPTRALETATPMAGIWPTTVAPSTHVFFTVPSTTPLTTIRPWSSLNQNVQTFNRLKFNQDFHRNYQRNRNLIRHRHSSRRHLTPLLRLIQQDPYLRFAIEFERLYKSLKQTTPTTTHSMDKHALMSALLEL